MKPDKLYRRVKRSNNIIVVTIYIRYNGLVKTLSQWSKDTDIPQRRLYDRLIKLKWPIHLALTIKHKKRYGTYIGKTVSQYLYHTRKRDLPD